MTDNRYECSVMCMSKSPSEAVDNGNDIKLPITMALKLQKRLEGCGCKHTSTDVGNERIYNFLSFEKETATENAKKFMLAHQEEFNFTYGNVF